LPVPMPPTRARWGRCSGTMASG